MMRKLAAGLCAAVVLVAGAMLPAEAATKVRRDPGTQVTAANDLQRARLTYRVHRTVYRLKIKDLSARHTRAYARFYRPGYDLFIGTFYRNGKRRVVAYRTDYKTFETKRFGKAVKVRWNFRTNSIRIENTRFLRGRSAQLDAYTVPKGRLHGPHGHPNDYVRARVRRG
jgi:hypothetical protein